MNATAARSRRGFAMVVAISLVAVVGLALGAVMSLSRLDLRRTVDAAESTQLRQMLLAGERAARQRLTSGGAGGVAGPVELPPQLAADAAALELRAEPAADTGGGTVVHVKARLGRRVQGQKVVYGRGAGGWQIVAVELERDAVE